MPKTTTHTGEPAPESKPPATSRGILWGLALGLACGLFFGEYCRPLKVIGDAFIKLLQVTVLPYITISLILGIGSLTGAQARELARKGGVLMLGFWGLALLMVLVMPWSFPHWQSAAFFSASLVEPPPPQNLLDLYIPSNPFRSLADNVVPAVVLFSLLVGIALMGVKEKARLLRGLEIAVEALGGVTRLIVRLAPVGFFAIVASATGTLGVEEFGRLHVFLLAYVVAAAFLTFWVLPNLVTLATPFTYREVLGVARDALITAFVTGNLFVALPVLTHRVKELFRHRGLQRTTTESYVDVVVPVAFNFPSLGEVLLLLFIFFAAWFSGSPVTTSQYPGLLVTGLLSAFGSLNLAIPYLLDQLKLPADLFQLYLVSGLVTTWFATLLAAMGLFVFAILSVAALTGVAVVRRTRLLVSAMLTALLLLVMVGGLRLYFGAFVKNTYTMAEVIGQMHLLREPLPAKVHRTPPPPLPAVPGASRLEAIRARGFLRVGYVTDRLPYTFENARGELVGFDIEMAHYLARALGVALEFAPVDRERFEEELTRGLCDIVMSGLAVTPERAARLGLSASYRDETLAFVVESFRRKSFQSRAAIQRQTDLRVGLLREPYHLAQLRAALPRAEIVEFSSPRDYFEHGTNHVDAFLYTAEAGSAWTLLYPRFAVVVPQPGLLSLPLAYAVPREATDFRDYVNAWIELKRKDGTLNRLYDYWIQGRGAVTKQPRWSILRNVFHWVK